MLIILMPVVPSDGTALHAVKRAEAQVSHLPRHGFMIVVVMLFDLL